MRESDTTKTIALNAYLSKAGVDSRRKCVDIVKSGRVSVNGKIIDNPACRVSASDDVAVDGASLTLNETWHVMLNKPCGYVCTSSDPHAEKTVFDLIKTPGVRLFTVGRLDKESEGLLLLTNDGEFAMRATHPRHGVKKRYEVTLDTPLTAAMMKRMLAGIVDQGETLRALAVESLGGKRYAVVMGEGKKREVRRLMADAGKKTIRLRRVAVGGLRLGNLPVGEWRRLSKKDAIRALSDE